MRLHLCGVRGSTPAPGPPFSRVGGHTSCVAVAHDGAGARSCCSTAGPGCGGFPSCSATRHSRGPCCSGTCTGITPRASRSSPPVTGPTPASTSTCPSPAATPTHALDGLMAPPFFPIDARPAWPERWSFTALDEGALALEGFTVLVREIPHAGGRTFGFRVERRRHLDRLRVRPRSDRPRPRSRWLGAVPRGGV